MKNNLPGFYFVLLCTFLSLYTTAQVPGVRWSKFISSGSNRGQGFYDAKPTSDNGYILVGADSTFTNVFGDYIIKTEGGRPWIVKVDSAGNKVWQNFLNSNIERSAFTSVTETPDGGFIATGFSEECCWDTAQVLIVKYNRNGVQQWVKKYGGTFTDIGYGIIKTKTSGYIIVASTDSNNGDVTGNHSNGYSDIWLLRIDESGNIIWKKCFGGSGDDFGYSVIQTSDYGFVVSGSALSTNGDLTGNLGMPDGWIFKTDSTGTLQWQKNYGGEGIDRLWGVVENPDGSLVATGEAEQTAQISNGLKALKNVWVIKLSATGTKIWSNAYGGSSNEAGFGIARMIDNTYLITGFVGSNDGDVSGINGAADAWLIRLSDAGNLLWQRCIGTNQNDFGMYVTYLSETDYIVAGTSRTSNFQDVGYIVKLGNSSLIKGTVFLDGNSNGIKDGGESNFNNAIIKTQKGSSFITAQPQNGAFRFDIDTGAYVTTVQLFNPYYNVVPASKNTNFTTYFNVDSFGFAIQPIPNKQDLLLHFVPASPARPGFKAQYLLNYKNVGTTTIANGSIKLIKDNRAALSIALPLPASVVADTITWNYTNLKPLDSVAIGIEFQLAAPPVLNINDTLRYTAVILPVAGDLTPADDTSRLRQRVVGSYDPNDKQENFAGRIPLKNVQDGSFINYIIRFQNTGNDTAFFVRLLDTLDAKLDWNSFQMIGSSHAYNLTIKDGNKLNWFFDNIKLPDSTTNFNRSIGYISFRIKPKTNLVANDVIQNKASIYFDYNLPIVTNTANTVVTVETTTGVRQVQNNEMKLLLGPNPANGYSLLQISGKLTGKFQLRMIDNNGRVISQQTLTRNSVAEILQVPLNMQQLSSGVYYIQLQQKEKSWLQKVVVQ